MNTLEVISQRRAVGGFVLLIIGYLLSSRISLEIFFFNISCLFLILFSYSALIVLFGYQSTKDLLKPLKRPFVRKILSAVGLSFLIVFGISIVLMMFFGEVAVTQNGNIPFLKSITVKWQLVSLLIIFLNIIGEELWVAGIVLPIATWLTEYKFNWLLANLIGCLIFALIHLEIYKFNIAICLIVGFSRYGFSMAWKSNDTLRGGIYAHLLYDSLLLAVNILL